MSIHLSPDNLEFMPYQDEGINWLISHKFALLGDEPGIGKTIQTIGLINFLAELDDLKILIFCPASVKLVWQKELNKWLMRPHRITTYRGENSEVTYEDENYEISIHLCNYDAVTKKKVRNKFIGKTYNRVKWDLIVMDECHILRNPEAKSTKYILGDFQTLGLNQLTDRMVGLSGTPMVNRPMDMQVLCSVMNEEFFTTDRHSYGTRFCDAKEDLWGWKYLGATNQEEFHNGLKTFMIRRYKKDVLPEMPPKLYQTIELGDSRYVKKEIKLLEDNGVSISDEYTVSDPVKLEMDSISENRRLMGESKAIMACEFIRDFINNTDEKVVVFAHHKSVIDKLVTGLQYAGYVKIVGSTSDKKREEAVENFQNGKARVFIGNLKSAGVGLTLTAASRVIFVELDWQPSIISQAIDRCHRVGQKDTVLAQFLVYNDSLEKRMAEILEKKSSMIEGCIDGNF